MGDLSNPETSSASGGLAGPVLIQIGRMDAGLESLKAARVADNAATEDSLAKIKARLDDLEAWRVALRHALQLLAQNAGKRLAMGSDPDTGDDILLLVDADDTGDKNSKDASGSSAPEVKTIAPGKIDPAKAAATAKAGAFAPYKSTRRLI